MEIEAEIEIGIRPSPSEYGLPYEEWRVGQYEAVKEVTRLIEESDCKVIMLIADTGVGKTGIATALANQYRGSTILCPTISLEEQYGKITGMEFGLGRRWHSCYQGLDALTCVQQEMCSGPCEYREHMERVRREGIRVLNYAQYLSIQAGKNPMGSSLVICDEGDGVDDKIRSFAESWYDEEVTWGAEYAQLLFGEYNKKVILMSATLIPELVAEQMGLEAHEYVVYEADNDFPPDANPVFVTPVGHITNKRPLTDKVVAAVDRQLASSKQNGIVHCASDQQVRDVIDGSRLGANRFIYPTGSDRARLIEEFKSRPANSGAVLISAGVYSGQDFPGDECRWQIICKVPYASLGSEVVKRRREERPDIYQMEAFLKIIQACGRGMRSNDDWCLNYILDANVMSLMKAHGHKVSRRFLLSWKGIKQRT